MKLNIQKEGLCANVIIDGKIMEKNLAKIKKDEKWLVKSLDVKGYKNISEILLATVDINEKLTVFLKHENDNILNVLE